MFTIFGCLAWIAPPHAANRATRLSRFGWARGLECAMMGMHFRGGQT